MSDRESRVRERAWQIWDEEGRPGHRADVHWLQAEQEIGKSGDTPGSLSNVDESPMASVGSASGLQPSGTTPGGSPAAGLGSIGSGGGSTAGAATGAVKQAKDRRRSLSKN
jgi:hypothetical protein